MCLFFAILSGGGALIKSNIFSKLDDYKLKNKTPFGLIVFLDIILIVFPYFSAHSCRSFGSW